MDANINIEIKYITEYNILMNTVKCEKYIKSDNNNISPIIEDKALV